MQSFFQLLVTLFWLFCSLAVIAATVALFLSFWWLIIPVMGVIAFVFEYVHKKRGV